MVFDQITAIGQGQCETAVERTGGRSSTNKQRLNVQGVTRCLTGKRLSSSRRREALNKSSTPKMQNSLTENDRQGCFVTLTPMEGRHKQKDSRGDDSAYKDDSTG